MISLICGLPAFLVEKTLKLLFHHDLRLIYRVGDSFSLTDCRYLSYILNAAGDFFKIFCVLCFDPFAVNRNGDSRLGLPDGNSLAVQR